MNNYQLTTNEFNTHYVRYVKHIQKVAWNEFNPIQQQVLCEKYNIKFTYHKSLKEKLEIKFLKLIQPYQSPKQKLKLFSKKLTIKNLNTGISKFNNGIDDFMKVIEPSKQSKQIDKDINKFLGLK